MLAAAGLDMLLMNVHRRGSVAQARAARILTRGAIFAPEAAPLPPDAAA
jgi:hypothetical protein